MAQDKKGLQAMSVMKMAAIVTMVMVAGLPAMAQQTYFYPAKGQTQEQQNRDQGDCHVWAVQQTGVNPYQGSGSAPPPSGGVIRGAAGGAALGAVGGAIGGNAGKGAAIGAGTGALFGGVRQHRQRMAQANQSQQMNDAYRHALGACMSGRGYTVG
jgi:YmgG-like glycine-zipper protein